jgi:HSP20 family protein
MAQELERADKSTTPPERISDPFELLRTEVNGLLDRFFGRPLFPLATALGNGGAMQLAPRIDVKEMDKAFLIEAEMPGMDEKNVEVTVKNGMLCITGEKSREKNEDQKDFHVMERQYGKFQRMLRLPDSVDQDKIEARFKKGVLKIDIPKRPEAVQQEKRIEVKSTA